MRKFLTAIATIVISFSVLAQNNSMHRHPIAGIDSVYAIDADRGLYEARVYYRNPGPINPYWLAVDSFFVEVRESASPSFLPPIQYKKVPGFTRTVANNPSNRTIRKFRGKVRFNIKNAYGKTLVVRTRSFITDTVTESAINTFESYPYILNTDCRLKGVEIKLGEWQLLRPVVNNRYGNLTYNWSTGETTRKITPNVNGGKYWVEVIDGSECVATDSLIIGPLMQITPSTVAAGQLMNVMHIPASTTGNNWQMIAINQTTGVVTQLGNYSGGSSPSVDVSALAFGTYTITVTDGAIKRSVNIVRQ